TSSIAVAASETLRVYVGVRGSGVLRSDDAGVTWAAYTNQYPYVDTLAIDVAPDNPDEVVTGTVGLTTQDTYDVTGFVLRTTDGGHTWTTALMGAGNVWNVRRCAADAKTMYAATTQGVARSSDRGATWTVSSLGPMTSVEDVEVNPSDCNSVYAMASDGPHHSTDGAKTFGPPLQQGLNLVPYGTYPGRMAIDPKNANGVLVGSHGGIWYSTDGSTWNTALGILGVQVDGMSVSAADPGRLWLASWGSGVWQRPSSTQPWQRVPTTALPVDYAFTVAADPKQKDRVLVGATVLYTSTDATSFSGRGVSQNELSFAFDPSNASVLYAATQLNGVYKSTDGGMTWSPSNSGITPWSSSAGAMAIDVNRVVIDPASAQTLYAATNGRGVYKSTDGAQSWTMVLGPMQVIPCLLAVPGSMAASPAATKLYACIQGAGLQSSSDGGATWADASKGLPTLNVNGLATDAATGRVYATAGADVYVLDGTGTWSALDSVCMPGGGVSLPVVVATGSGRSLVVAGGGSVQAHAL
ncbi:MAG TPA: hypothetical protein VKU41_00445, partial [Polyangiaceae bacterium]|nr:hypothetical protein [Polyangiaceae bacterium]